jgi:imidazolonepropionase-like amidohydrolase
LEERIAILLLSSTCLLAETIAIRAGTLIDLATGSAARGAVILVKEGKIIEVGPRVVIPKEAETIDLASWWVMPGLMDVHTHLTFQLPAERVWSLPI